MRIGIIGYSGMVGQELLKFPDTIPLPCDVRDENSIEMAIEKTKVDFIVHLASVSDVDECEKDSNLTRVKDVNVLGALNVFEQAEKRDIEVTTISSAQVFDGIWGNYKENSKPSPVNRYGISKAGADEFAKTYNNVKVIRTSYLFDYRRLYGEVYALRNLQFRTYPTFMIRSFMYVPHFVESLYYHTMNWNEMPPMLNVAGWRNASWHQFMLSVANAFGASTDYVLARSTELRDMVRRPKKATLNTSLSKSLGFAQHDYVDGLIAMRELF